MISNPHAGWCDFQLGAFEGHPSYITDVPIDLLQAFLDFHEKGSGSVWLDEEDRGGFSFVLNPYAMYVIEERDQVRFWDLTTLNPVAVELELIADISSRLPEWALFSSFSPELVTKKEIPDDQERAYVNQNIVLERQKQVVFLKNLIEKVKLYALTSQDYIENDIREDEENE